MTRRMRGARRTRPIRHQQPHPPIFDAPDEDREREPIMKKIVFIMISIMAGAPILRGVLSTDSDGHTKNAGSGPSFLNGDIGGGMFSGIVALITQKVMGQAPSTQTPPAGSGKSAGPGRMADTRAPGGPPGAASGDPNLARGADGILTPDIARFLNPSVLTGLAAAAGQAASPGGRAPAPSMPSATALNTLARQITQPPPAQTSPAQTSPAQTSPGAGREPALPLVRSPGAR